jgi:hypothetical protein
VVSSAQQDGIAGAPRCGWNCKPLTASPLTGTEVEIAKPALIGQKDMP